MKIIRGRKSGLDCVVELDNESYRTKLSLEKSLKIADHSPDGFQWGYSGSGPAQLAAAILYEITDDVELLTNILRIIQARPCIAMERHL